MTVANEIKLLRRWIKQQRPFGRGRTYSPALRHRILAFVDLATAAGMGKHECCEAIGVSRKAVAAWRRAEPSDTTSDVSDESMEVLPEVSVEPVSRALVPVEITPSPSSIRLGGGLSLVTPRGFRVEGISLEQAFALLREFE